MNNKFKILDNSLTINKISKIYGNKQVVRDISLSIKQREIVGLLGPNGSGKTTLIKIICGLLNHIDGNLFINNKDLLSQIDKSVYEKTYESIINKLDINIFEQMLR